MAQRGLIDHPDKVRGRLIMHAPPTIRKRKRSTMYKFARGIAYGIIGFTPPALEEGLLYVRELALRVAIECADHAAQDGAHTCVLDGIVGA